MLLVRDVMTRQPFMLEAIASTEEAAWALTTRRIGGAPVIDADGNVIGMLSKSDLVDPAPNEWIAGEGTVADRMIPKVFAVYDSDPALAAAEMMADRQIHRVLVLGEDGQPAGIVSTMDVVKALARGDSFALEP